MSILRYAFRRWYSTVFGVTNSAWAISRLLWPVAASSAIRRSDGVSDAGPESSASRRGRAAAAGARDPRAPGRREPPAGGSHVRGPLEWLARVAAAVLAPQGRAEI